MALSPVLTKVAQALIKKFGRTVTIIEKGVTEIGYDPETGTDYGASTTTETDIIGFVSTYTTRDYGEMITLGDMPLYTTIAIDKGNDVKIDGVTWAVTMVQQYNVEASTVLYVANLRRL